MVIQMVQAIAAAQRIKACCSQNGNCFNAQALSSSANVKPGYQATQMQVKRNVQINVKHQASKSAPAKFASVYGLMRLSTKKKGVSN